MTGYMIRRAVGCGLLLCWLIAVLAVVSPGWSGRTGPSKGEIAVIDGDTIEFDGRAVHLAGIDAPELGQRCLNQGKKWRCGLEAALALQKLISFGPVDCKPAGGDEVRPAVICTAQGKDLGEALLRQGYAVAQPGAAPAYANAQAAAKQATLGLWRGKFVAPAEWRQGVRLAGETDDPSLCVVKGVINSRNQRLYYVPSDAGYDDIEIDPGRGERMFCSDDQALLAGWTRHPIMR